VCARLAEGLGFRSYARMHACSHARMHACTHARMHACTHAHTDLEKRAGDNPAMCLYVCPYHVLTCMSLLCPYMYVLIMSLYVCPYYVLVCMSLYVCAYMYVLIMSVYVRPLCTHRPGEESRRQSGLLIHHLPCMTC